MKDRADLVAAGLSDDEAMALLGVALCAEGSTDLKQTIRAPYHAAIDALIQRGLVEQQWMLSKAARDMLGLQSGD